MLLRRNDIKKETAMAKSIVKKKSAPKAILTKTKPLPVPKTTAAKPGSGSKTLKIATFNANSIRVRMEILLNWLKKEQPDVVAVQETKVQDHEFPREPLEAAGWNVVFRGQKSYNGVAFISKKPVTNIV